MRADLDLALVDRLPQLAGASLLLFGLVEECVSFCQRQASNLNVMLERKNFTPA